MSQHAEEELAEKAVESAAAVKLEVDRWLVVLDGVGFGIIRTVVEEKLRQRAKVIAMDSSKSLEILWHEEDLEEPCCFFLERPHSWPFAEFCPHEREAIPCQAACDQLSALVDRLSPRSLLLLRARLLFLDCSHLLQFFLPSVEILQDAPQIVGLEIRLADERFGLES